MSNQKGSAIVEVAIVFPLMLIVILAFIYFIELSRVGIVMEAAATEGARTLAIDTDTAAARQKIIEVLGMGHVSLVGEGFYSITIDDKTVTVKRKVGAVPFYGGLEMQRSAQHQGKIERLYYGKGAYGPGWTGSAY